MWGDQSILAFHFCSPKNHTNYFSQNLNEYQLLLALAQLRNVPHQQQPHTTLAAQSSQAPQPPIHPLIQIQQIQIQNTLNALNTAQQIQHQQQLQQQQQQRAAKRPRTPEQPKSYRIDDLLDKRDEKVKTPPIMTGPLTSTPKKGSTRKLAQ